MVEFLINIPFLSLHFDDIFMYLISKIRCCQHSSGRIPVRLYIRSINEDIDDLEDAPTIDSWDKISYINRPFEIQGEGKRVFDCFCISS